MRCFRLMRHALTLAIAGIILFVFPLVQAGGEENPKNAVGAAAEQKLTLTDCILLALMNSNDVKDVYLDRIVQRYTLKQAEQRYYLPTDPSLTLSTVTTSTYSDTGRTQSQTQEGKFIGYLMIPTGGTFTVTWDNPATKADTGQDYGYSSTWTVNFTQPLLKGGGIDNASYTVKVARITEDKNILALRDTIKNTISTAITNFRDYRSKRRSLEIAQKTLEDSKRTYEQNKAKIEVGRLPTTDIVQTETSIATNEVNLIQAKNALEKSRLTLMSFLNIDKNLLFDPEAESEIKISLPSLKEAVDIAFKNRTDYLTKVLDLEIKKWDVQNANRNKMWQLDLTANTAQGGTGVGDTYPSAFGSQNISKRDWNVGLALTIPLTILRDDVKTYLTAKNALDKAERNLKKTKTDMEIEIQDALRTVEMSYLQLQRSHEARALAEKQLEIENLKLSVGRSTNFQVLDYQNKLRDARVQEQTSVDSYLDSLKTLDEKLGITLERWKIAIRKDDETIRLPSPEKKSTNQPNHPK